MENNVIRFEQAVIKVTEAERIEECQTKINLIVRTFSKNTLLQFMCFDIFGRAIELGEHLREGDISNLLFKELDKLFSDFEDLQNNEKLIALKESMQETVTKFNERLKEENEKQNQK